MQTDAVYYTRREKEEHALAELGSNSNVRRVHAILAQKYSELAQLEVAALELNEGAAAALVEAPVPAR